MIHPAAIAAVYATNAGTLTDARLAVPCSHDGATVTAPDPFGGETRHCLGCGHTWQPDEAVTA